MVLKIRFLSIVLSFAMLVSGTVEGVRGAMVTLNPIHDNSIYAESNNSNGAGTGLFIGATLGRAGTSIRRALMQFDFASSIPAGSNINSATLTIQRVFGGPNAGSDILELHPVVSAWGEGTSRPVGTPGGKGAAPTPSDATWNFRYFSTDSWTTPGGDFGPTSGTVLLDGNDVFTFVSQNDMVADVQNWVNNPASNFGWLLKYADENAAGSAREFYSRESGFSPSITIDFTTAVPEPSSFFILSVASLCASLSIRRRIVTE